MQGKHRTDSIRGRPRAGRQNGDAVVFQTAKVWVTRRNNRRKGTTSRNIRHKESITRFRKGFKVTLRIQDQNMRIYSITHWLLNTHYGQNICSVLGKEDPQDEALTA